MTEKIETSDKAESRRVRATLVRLDAIRRRVCD